jgi:hypothetical protein
MTPLIPTGDLAAMQAVLDDFSNARLLEIAPTGAPDLRGQTQPAAASWEGSALGYLARQQIAESAGREAAGAADRQIVRHIDVFTLPDAAGAPVSELAGPRWKGTYVTIEDRRLTPFVTTRYRVTDMVHQANGLLDAIVLELADPKVL